MSLVSEMLSVLAVTDEHQQLVHFFQTDPTLDKIIQVHFIYCITENELKYKYFVKELLKQN